MNQECSKDEFGDASGPFASVYRVLREAIRDRAFPGCAFGVLAGDKVVLADGLGRFTYEEDAPTVSAETVFDIASITKVAATTAAAMLLWQRGDLNIEARVGDLLPGFVAGRSGDDPARRITLRHLLAHHSGLPGYVEFFRTLTTARQLTQALFELKLEAEPGMRAEYSDPGFMLLGKALEALTGEPLDGWVEREVLVPLGMSATCYCPLEAARPLIPPTEEDTRLRHRLIQGEVQDENAWVLGGVAGNAGVFSNVPDLLRFASEILKAQGLRTALTGLRRQQLRGSLSGRVRRAARGRWAGIRPLRCPLQGAIFRRARSGIWVIAAALCGLTGKQRSRSRC